MHTIAISETARERVRARVGKLHPFDTIEPRRTALLGIDMQNYFVKPGHHGEVPMARRIVPNINRLGGELRRRGGHVVWIRNGTAGTRQSWSNYHDGLMTPERMRRRYEAMEEGQEGFEFWHQNDIRPEDTCLTKTRYSAFIHGSSDVERRLRERDADTVLIAGTATNICCESTARDAMLLDFRTTMVSDANADHTDAEHNATLINFCINFGDVATTDDLVARIASHAPDQRELAAAK